MSNSSAGAKSSLPLKEQLLYVLIVVVVIGGLSALAMPLYSSILAGAGERTAEKLQSKLAETQAEIKEETGTYAGELNELVGALEEAGLTDEARELVSVRATEAEWCAVSSLERGRMANLIVQTSSTGAYEIFESVSAAIESCELK